MPLVLAEYTAAVLADDPEVYWRYQDVALPLTDSSGNSFPSNGSTNPGDLTLGFSPGPCGDDVAGTWAGASASPTGAFRNARPFAAVNNWTLEMWLRPITAANSSLIFFIGDGSSDGFGIGFTGAAARQIRGVAPGVANMPAFANVPPANVWTHVAVVRRANVWEYYFNGAQDTANAGTNIPNAATQQTWSGWLFNGANYRVAHLAAYDTALTEERITAHFDAASEEPPPTPTTGNPGKIYIQGGGPQLVMSPGAGPKIYIEGGE